jgi:5-methylcytosine-specific restriction endonuclease McrBC regulatory subunit McrC
LAFTRLNRQWEPAAELALMILRQEALKDEMGAEAGIAFTVDMNTLFAKFVEEVVGEEAIRVGLRLRPQAPVPLTESTTMRPDLVLKAGQRSVAVGDAKCMELEPDN